MEGGGQILCGATTKNTLIFVCFFQKQKCKVFKITTPIRPLKKTLFSVLNFYKTISTKEELCILFVLCAPKNMVFFEPKPIKKLPYSVLGKTL